MTTYPAPTDPASALTKADGTTRAHSLDHGVITDLVVNAKRYLKGDGTTESAAQITAFNSAAQGNLGYFPPGTYVLPDATGFTASTSTRFVGSGPSTSISYKNVYAFLGDWGAINWTLEDMYVFSRTGGTSGGVVEVRNGQARISRVLADGGGGTDPLFYFHGSIGGHIDQCGIAGGAKWGVLFDSGDGGQAGAAFNNANTIYRTRVAGCGWQTPTVGAIEISGGAMNRIHDCIAESNLGYGVTFTNGTNANTLAGTWFEDNYKTSVLSGGITSIMGCQFASPHPVVNGGDVTANSVEVTGDYVTIMNNEFKDPALSGIHVKGNNADNLTILNNYNLQITGTPTISGYAGDNVMLVAPSSTSTVAAGGFGTASATDYTYLPGVQRQVRYKGTDVSSDGPSPFETAIASFVASDNSGGTFVTQTGHVMFANESAPAWTMPTGTFALYYDNASGQIRARVRKDDASYKTHVLSYDVLPAYTVTNPTTDRALNVTGDTLAQVAQVLGTLIADLQAAGVLI